jgi:hypothetical protein
MSEESEYINSKDEVIELEKDSNYRLEEER